MMMQRLRGSYFTCSEEFYEGSEVCEKVDNKDGECRTKLCMMSPWLCNLHIDGVMRKLNERVLGKGMGLELNGHELDINKLLHVVDSSQRELN